MSHSTEYLEKIYNLLPRIYRNEDAKNKYYLKRFLEVIVEGGVYPVYKETKGILSLIDLDKVEADYLPHLASSLGFTFPYDLDEQTQRTFIKNAVSSYKIKGTKPALEFMIREITRFNTQIVIDENLKKLDVILEVDVNRQYADRVVEKVDFLVNEYAPLYKEYNLINVFDWGEEAGVYSDELVRNHLIVSMTDFSRNYDGWFLTNDTNSLTNQTPLPHGETYIMNIGEEYSEIINVVE